MKKIIYMLLVLAAVNNCKKKDIGNMLVIEKISATSTAKGYLKYDVQNIFGGGEWRSEPSFYPMDGVLINLLDPAKITGDGKVAAGAAISAIQVECPSSGINALDIYINGSHWKNAKCNEKIAVNSKVSSLFIKGQAEKRFAVKESFIISKILFYHNDKENREVEYEPLFPEKIPGKVVASSVLGPVEAFQPYFIFDGRTDFGWSEDAQGAGIGESVSVKLDDTMQLEGLEIYTGFQMSESHFSKNAIPTRLEFKSGDYKETLTLNPVYGSQRIHLKSPQKTNEFSLKILSAKPGSQWQDALISEVTLLGKDNQRYTVYDKKAEDDVSVLQAKIKSSTLESFVGQALRGEDSNTGSSVRLLFRSNASFVIYQDSNMDNSNIVMDGNWLLTKAGTDQSKIYIIGKLHKIERFTENDGSYGSESRTYTEENDFVFSDNITVSEADGKYTLASKRINAIFSNQD